MRVVIAGGHGKIALLLARLLAGRGDQAVGLIRNPAQAADVQKAGAEAVVCDLETASIDDVAALLSGADAVVSPCGSLVASAMIGASLAPPSDLMPPAALTSSTASLVALTIISPTLAFGPESGTITAISTLSAACADLTSDA